MTTYFMCAGAAIGGFFAGIFAVDRAERRSRQTYLERKAPGLHGKTVYYGGSDFIDPPDPTDKDYALDKLNKKHPELVTALASGDYDVKYDYSTSKPTVTVPMKKKV